MFLVVDRNYCQNLRIQLEFPTAAVKELITLIRCR
jgi:hypothetical protein